MLRARAFAGVVFGCVTAAFASAEPTRAPQAEPAFDSGRLLVRLGQGASLPEELAGARHLFGNWWAVQRSAEKPSRVERDRLSRAVGVERVERDRLYRLEPAPASVQATSSLPRPVPPMLVANDPLFDRQWHHRAVEAEAAWLRSTGETVIVAVIDSGVTPGGPDGFCHPLAGEYDAVRDLEGAGRAEDLIGHGTFVASVIAECTGNAIGAAGLAPDARILAIRACTLDGECASSDVAVAIDWAATHGARVINLSLGMPCGGTDWPECSTAIENEAIARAVAAGVLIVANAGNGGEDHLGFPANHPEVLGVGGLNALFEKTSYSSWGTALSLTAPAGEPGVDRDGDGYEDQILQETLRRVCAAPGGAGFEYCLWSGTSFAAPHVAAAAALLLAERPEASRNQIRRALEESARDRGAPGFDVIYGHGTLDAAQALLRLDEILAGACVPSVTTLCLGDGRFDVRVRWRDYADRAGDGVALPLSPHSGLFWFFEPDNLEMLVKVVDGCGFNGHRWVFAAATTDVGYELVVTEVATGLTRTYSNALGTASPAVTDTAAFACSTANAKVAVPEP